MSKEEDILKEILREVKQSNQFNFKIIEILEKFKKEAKIE